VRSLFVVAAFACVAFGLAACGGGGGGSSSGASGVYNPVPSPSSSAGANLSQTSVERTDAQGALAGVQTYEEIAGGGSISTLTARRAMHSMLAKLNPKALIGQPRRPATCNDGSGVNETVTATTITIEQYYDDECTEPEAEIVWTYTQLGDEVTGPATFTEYSVSGATTETANAQITFEYNGSDQLVGFAFLLSNIVDQGTQLGSTGVACIDMTSEDCDVASIANAAPLDAEDGVVVSAAVTNTSTLAVTMQISTYQGAENALTIVQGVLPNWTITPASDLTQSLSISGSSSASGFTLTLTDNTNGGSFAIIGTAGGATGTLTNTATGATVASFSVNAQGNGTLTYGNGSTASIVDYVVQS
jgi:hypothetical protein